MKPLRRIVNSDFVRHGSLMFASTMLVNVFNYVLHFFVSRQLGVNGYGTFSSLLALIVISSVVAVVGGTVVAKLAAELHAVSDFPKLRALADRLLLVGTVVALFCVAIIVLATRPITAYMNLAEGNLVPLAGAVIGVSILVLVLRGMLQGTQRFREFTIAASLESIGRAVGCVGLVWLGHGVFGALLGFGLGSVLSLAYTIYALRAFGKPAPVLRLDTARLIRSAAGIGTGIFALTVLQTYDLLLVKHYFSAHLAGNYSAAGIAGRALFLLISFVPTVLLPKATSRTTSGRSTGSLLLAAGSVTAFLALITLLVFGTFPALIVRIVAGPSFADAAAYVLPYGVATAFLAAANVSATYQIGLHRFGFVPFLLLIFASEVAAISMFHRSLTDVLTVIIVGHACALLATLWRVNVPAISPVPLTQ